MSRPLDMDVNFMFPGMPQQNAGGPMAIMPAPGQMQMNMGGNPGFMSQQPPMGGMGGFQ